MLGKLFPFACVGFLDTLLVCAVAVGLFRVPFRGSLPLLVLFTIPFLVCTLGLGLFVSTLVRTQQQAMMSAVYLVMVPIIYLSGLIFPVEAFRCCGRTRRPFSRSGGSSSRPLR